jgi:hypothetical protein
MGKTKAVKDWENKVREAGCIITGQNDVQLHHVHGRTYKNMKVLIGPWFILPLCMRLHDVHSNDPYNVTHYPNRFGDEIGKQKDLFFDMCQKFIDEGDFQLPFESDVMQSILATNR